MTGEPWEVVADEIMRRSNCGLCGRDLTYDRERRFGCCDECFADEMAARGVDA